MYKLFRTSQIALALLTVGSMISCSPATPKLIPMPEVINEKVSADSDNIDFTPKVDILFVVDNSGSMGTHQANLANNLSKFVQTFTAGMQIDYNVGVVSTDMSDYRHSGRLQGNVRYVNKSTPNGIATMAGNIMTGTNGDWQEKSFDPVIAALSNPLIGSYNSGFYRQDAHIAVVFITDAEDQSNATPTELYEFLKVLKGTKDRVLAYGVIVPSNAKGCSRDDVDLPKKIESFLAMPINAGKNLMSLCDSNFGTKLADLSKDIARYVGAVIYLNRPPVLSTLRVVFGTQVIMPGIKTGWTFDAAKNAIILGEGIVWSQQPAGTRVKVYFDAAQYEGQ